MFPLWKMYRKSWLECLEMDCISFWIRLGCMDKTTLRIKKNHRLNSDHIKISHNTHNIIIVNVGYAQYGKGDTTPSRGNNDSSRLQPNGTLLDCGRDVMVFRILGNLTWIIINMFMLGLNPRIASKKANRIKRRIYSKQLHLMKSRLGRPVPDEGYTESPPPPPSSTSIHPLYNKRKEIRGVHGKYAGSTL